MAINLTTMAATAANLVAQAPVSIVHSGTTYSVARLSKRAETAYMLAGAEAEYEFSVLAPVATFTGGVPSPRQTVTFGGVTYRILAVETDPLGVMVRLDLGAQYVRR